MDWLTFIATMTGHIIWPVAVLFIVVFLRRPLLGLIPLMRKFKWNQLELEFGKEVAEAKVEAEKVLPSAKTELVLPAPFEALVQASPRAAIVEAWREVENAAGQALSKHAPQETRSGYRSPLQVAAALRNANILEPDEFGLFQRLRSLRNQAAHAPDFALGEDSAREYIKLATRLADRLRSS